MRPPKLIKPYVTSFCRDVVADPQPVYVPIRPLDGAPQNECFTIVPDYISKHGGEQVVGWSIWEWPDVFIEAEFHTVVRQSDGTWLDITPKIFPMPRILFLPDSSRVYRGRQVNNIRKPLGRNPGIKRFCELCTLIYQEMNKGELADYHGPIVATPLIQRYMAEKAQIGMMLERRYGVYSPEGFES